MLARPVPRPHIDRMRDVGNLLADALTGRYEIQRELGRGGAAAVFAATDIRHGRDVAIKVLDTGEAGGGERFQREVALIARLRHPHIVPLYDSGRSGDLCWFVMPLFEGRTLRDRLEASATLSLEETIRIASDVADALTHAHGQGVIHRDVKPENILLEGDHAALSDFGIARLTAADGAVDGDRLTATGVIVGTPAYMSPEQISMSHGIDARSDVYSLGCVVYEMLAGRPPYGGTRGRPVHVQHLTEPVPRLVTSGHNVPLYVEAAVQRALAKDPANRFPDATAFVAALRGRGDRADSGPTTRHTRVAVLGAALAIVALLGLVAGAYLRAGGGKDQQGKTAAIDATVVSGAQARVTLAVLPLANLSRDPDNGYFSDGVLEDLLVALNRVPRLSVSPRTSSFRFKGQSLSLRAIAESLHVTHVVEGSVRREGSTVRIAARLVRVSPGAPDSVLWADDFTREMQSVLSLQGELADVIAKRLLTTLLPADRALLTVRNASNPEAYDRYLKGRFYWYQRTTPALLQAVRFYREALAIDSTYARAWAGLADAYSLLPWTGGMRPVEARPLATAAAARALQLDSLLAEAHVSAGIVRTFFDWDWAGANRAIAEAIRLDSASAQAHLFQAWPLVAQGKLDLAMASLERARQLDPLALVINARVATVHAYRHQYAAAEAAARRALEIDPGFAMARAQLARVLSMNGRHAEAIAALPANQSLVGSYEAGIAGFVYAKAGRRDEARRELARLEQLPSAAFDAIAAIQLALGDREAALGSLERSLQARNFTLVFLHVEPMFDALHGEPRFTEIVEKVGAR